jgi:hypothetical protein
MRVSLILGLRAGTRRITGRGSNARFLHWHRSIPHPLGLHGHNSAPPARNPLPRGMHMHSICLPWLASTLKMIVLPTLSVISLVIYIEDEQHH